MPQIILIAQHKVVSPGSSAFYVIGLVFFQNDMIQRATSRSLSKNNSKSRSDSSSSSSWVKTLIPIVLTMGPSEDQTKNKIVLGLAVGVGQSFQQVPHYGEVSWRVGGS